MAVRQGGRLLRERHILSPAFALALDVFLLAKEGEGLSPRTLYGYRFGCGRFLSHLTEHGLSTPQDITPGHVREYFADLRRHNFKPHTVHDYARPVKTMLRFWHVDGVIETDVMARVKMPRADNQVLPALSENEVKRLLQACETKRETALVLFLLDTGVRASECCSITVNDCDLRTGAIRIEHGKGGKRRTVYTGTQARRALMRYLLERGNPQYGPLFAHAQTGAYVTANGILQVLRRLSDRAGVEVSPHKLRRTFALTCLRNGMDIRRLAALMGHSDIDVLRPYLAIAEHDLQTAHEQYGPVDALLLSKGGKR